MFAQLGRLRRYVANSSWILAERFAGLAVSFVVTVAVARYLGADQFGVLAYAASLASLFAAAGHMGLSGIVVREVVKKPSERESTLGSAMGLKAIGYFGGFLILLTVSLFSEGLHSDSFWVVVIVAASMLVKPLEVFDFWFQAHIQAKFSAIARFTAQMLAAALKLALVFAGAQLVAFAAVYVVQASMAGALMFLLYRLKADASISSWRFEWPKAKELVSQGWLVFLGSIFALVYLKIDQIMLRWLVGAEEVGVYAVATSLSEAWYFVPTAIVASFFPPLIRLRESGSAQYGRRLQQVFDFLFLLASVIAVVVTLAAKPVVGAIFGEEYLAAAPILVVHVWAGLFIFMRAALSKWILIENMLVFSLLTQGFGALANVILNFLLIPPFAGYGAAVATLLSYAVASYFALLVSARSRPVFWMMTKAMVSPIRYGYALLRGLNPVVEVG